MVTQTRRKRELHTRVPEATRARVRAYATANGLTLYRAVEALVLKGLDGGTGTAPTGPVVPEGLAQLAAKLDALTALVDRALFGALVAYAYARSAALQDLTGDARQTRDRSLLEAGQDTYTRQRKQALEA